LINMLMDQVRAEAVIQQLKAGVTSAALGARLAACMQTPLRLLT
jgi:hypothetical protein